MKISVGEFVSVYHTLKKVGEIDFNIKLAIKIAIAMDAYSKAFLIISKRHTQLFERYGEVSQQGKRQIKPENVLKFDTEFRAYQQEEIEIPPLGISATDIENGTTQAIAPNIIMAILRLAGE